MTKSLAQKKAETFEQALYFASQEEYRTAAEEKKRSLLNLRFGLLYKLRFFFEDYVLEPCLTCLRFAQLSAIFVPVFLVYPFMIFLGPKIKSKGGDRLGKLLWNKLLKFCIEHAGACFIKLGQWAASRNDIFSKNFCAELGSLHLDAKAHLFRETRRIICESFEVKNFDEIFEEFIKKPVGVGSIAQVHVGKLSESYLRKVDDDIDLIEQDRQRQIDDSFVKSTIADLKERFSLYKYHRPQQHQWVAVKVMHPNVETKIDRDLRIMAFFAKMIDMIPTMEWLSLPEEVEQFSTFMRIQLDLRIEGINLNKFAKNFERKELRYSPKKVRLQVKFLKPYLKCLNRHVLVEEYIHALPIATILGLTQEVQDKVAKGTAGEKEKKFLQLNKIISNEVLDSFLQMLILDNFIHSDLHPGNIFVRFFKQDNNYALDDASPETDPEVAKDMQTVTTELLREDRQKGGYDRLLDSFSRLYDAGYQPEVCYLDTGLVTELNDRDRVNFLELFKALSTFDGFRAGELMIERSRDPDSAIDSEIFALKVQRLVETIKNRAFTLGNISIGDLLDKMLTMVRKHHVKMEPDFVNVVVAILLLEGMGRQLDPDLDLFARLVWTFMFGLPSSQDIRFLADS